MCQSRGLENICANQGVRNVSLWENFAFTKWMLPHCKKYWVTTFMTPALVNYECRIKKFLEKKVTFTNFNKSLKL